MSKVDTLLKLISYEKQHPQANDEEIAQAIGISPGHVRRCKKEVHLLRHHLAEPTLQPHQIQFLLSQLNQHELDQKEIAQQLQKQMGISYTGTLRTIHPNEQVPLSWLEIGEVIPAKMGDLDGPDRNLIFWLQNLCYDPLLIFDQNGEIEGRLATSCEAVKGHAQWYLTLRKDLRWSDGKPMTLEEVIKAFSTSHIAPIIEGIKPDGKTNLRIQLSQEEPFFPFQLRNIFVLPSHSAHSYRVISGAYRLKRFRPDAITFRFEPNPNYYRDENPSIDWLTLKRFTHPAHAIKAIEKGTLDLLSLYLHPLQSFRQFPTTIPCQQWPFFENNYYTLFLNRRRGALSDKENCNRLKQALDYRAINLYLRMGQVAEETESLQRSDFPLDIRIACSRVGVLHYLAHLIGLSVGSSVVNPISVKGDMREEADAFLTQALWGFEYSHLSRFFRSDGIHNFFGYANPQADEMLSQLDRVGDLAARRRIGREVLSLLQEDFAIIPLAPCLQYTYSPLEIQFDDKLTCLTDLAQNMSQLIVERH